MNLPTRKEAVRYLYDQVLAQFTGFCIGIYSTGIVSRFFETRSFSNLWGILARKTVVDEGTFSALERIVAVVIGFIVFVIVTTILKPLLERLKPVFYQEIVPFAKERGWDAKWETLKADVKTKSVACFASLSVAIRDAVRKLMGSGPK